MRSRFELKFGLTIDILLAVFCMFCTGIFAVYSGQDAGFDFLNYHFYNPFALLTGKYLLDLAPANIQTFHNPLLDIPAFLMIRNLEPKVFGFILGAIQGLNGIIIYKIFFYCVHRNRLLAILLLPAGMLGAVNISEIGMTMNDNLVSIPVLFGVFLLVKRFFSERKMNLLEVLAGALILGVGVGLKITTNIYGIGVVGGVLSLPGLTFSKKIKYLGATFLGLFIGLGASYGYWAYFLLSNYSNPVFPYFNNYFQSPFMVPGAVNLYNRFYFHDLWHGLLLPFYILKDFSLVSEIYFFDLRLSICMALFFLSVLFSAVRICRDKWVSPSPAHSFLFFFFVASYLTWLTQPVIYRYLSVLEFICPAFIFVSLSFLFSNKRVVYALTFILCYLAVVTVRPVDWGHVPWSKSFFDETMPQVDSLDRATIVINASEPLAYVVPLFPKTTQFINLATYLGVDPRIPTEWRTLIEKAFVQVELQRRPLFLLRVVNEQNKNSYFNGDFYLNHWKLAFKENECKPWGTKFHRDLQLCPLTKR